MNSKNNSKPVMIDTHVHLYDGGWPPGSLPGLSGEEMLEAMDQYGITQAWISSVSGLVRDFKGNNDKLYQFTRLAPERFALFCTVNPNFPEYSVDEIKRCSEILGCKGLKLHPWLQSFSTTFKIVGDIVETCIQYDLPILFHDGTPPYSDSLQVAWLAEKYPEAKIILGHSGLLDSWRSAASAARRFNNLYLCLCGPAIGDVEYLIDHVDNSRLLFGSDFGGSSLRILQDFLGIIEMAVKDENLKRRILYENAASLLRVQRVKG
jgi:uncharacterized protein